MERASQILIVDDETEIRDFLEEFLQAAGYETETAHSGIEALAKMKLGVDLVLLDVKMPGMDGFEVVRKIREDPEIRDIPVIMVAALGSKEDRIRAVKAGASDFIAKPVDLTEVEVRVNSLIEKKQAFDTIKRHRAELEETVEKRTADLRNALQEVVSAQEKIRDAHLETIHHLAVAAEFKDKDTATHIERVSHYCRLLAEALHLTPSEVDTFFYASPMHDVGKVGVPESVLLKPGKLDSEEWDVMKQHTVIGSQILTGSSSELIQAGEVIALSHHEKWDGSGYPRGLKGDEIPIFGRICAVADVFDALSSKRPYKKAFSTEETIGTMKESGETHFDPQVFEVFLKNLDAIFEIQERIIEKTG
jgi:putative two-component system response regulator